MDSQVPVSRTESHGILRDDTTDKEKGEMILMKGILKVMERNERENVQK
jgi:hypothetical protein